MPSQILQTFPFSFWLDCFMFFLPENILLMSKNHTPCMDSNSYLASAIGYTLRIGNRNTKKAKHSSCTEEVVFLDVYIV